MYAADSAVLLIRVIFESSRQVIGRMRDLRRRRDFTAAQVLTRLAPVQDAVLYLRTSTVVPLNEVSQELYNVVRASFNNLVASRLAGRFYQVPELIYSAILLVLSTTQDIYCLPNPASRAPLRPLSQLPLTCFLTRYPLGKTGMTAMDCTVLAFPLPRR